MLAMASSNYLEQLKKYKILSNVEDVFLKDVKLIHLVQCDEYLGLNRKHTAILVLTNDNVYSVGSNKWGCRGVEDRIRKVDEKSIPTKIKTLCQKSVTAIYSGNSYIIARTVEGDLYGWGYNGFGSLGLSTTKHVGFPTKIPGLGKITDVACGHGHTLAMNEDGDVFAWGLNANGQVGTGKSDNQLSPYELPGLKAKSIAAGSYFSVVCTAEGKVFAWGSNSAGQIGCGNEAASVWKPSNVAVSTEIRQLEAGSEHVIAVSTSNTMLTWGRLRYPNSLEKHIINSISPATSEMLTPIKAVFSCISSNSIVCETARKLFVWGGNSNNTEHPVASECNNFNAYICDQQITGRSFKISHLQELQLPSFESFMEAIFDSQTEHNAPDVHFKFGEKVIRVHKQILQKQCSYFQNVFDWDLACLNGEIPLVIIAGSSVGSIRYEPFHGFLYYIYTDKINLTCFQDVMDLYLMASLFSETKLQKNAGQLLHKLMNLENVTEIYGKSSCLGDQNLVEASKEFMNRNSGKMEMNGAVKEIKRESKKKNEFKRRNTTKQ